MKNRDGKVNPDDGYSMGDEGIELYKWPRVAQINEIVGAYTLILLSGNSVRQQYERKFDELPADPLLPSTEQRIKVGAVVNTVTLILGAAIAIRATNGFFETYKTFGRL